MARLATPLSQHMKTQPTVTLHLQSHRRMLRRNPDQCASRLREDDLQLDTMTGAATLVVDRPQKNDQEVRPAVALQALVLPSITRFPPFLRVETLETLETLETPETRETVARLLEV